MYKVYDGWGIWKGTVEDYGWAERMADYYEGFVRDEEEYLVYDSPAYSINNFYFDYQLQYL